MSQVSGKRILLLCGWYYPDSVGGTETYVRNLGKELRDFGWEVFVGAPSVDEQGHLYSHDGLPVYRYPVSLDPSKEEIRGTSAPKYLDIFSNWTKELRPDIVHFHSRTRGCGFYHVQSVKQLGIPMVLTIHAADFMCVAGTARLWGVSPCDGRIEEDRCTACLLKNRGVPLWWLAWLFSRMPDWFMHRLSGLKGKPGTFFSMKRLFLNRHERETILLDSFSRIIVVAKWLYNVVKINGIAEERLYYCRHGISKATSIHNPDKRPDPQGKIRVGFVGRFDHVKGIHVLVRAVRSLPRHIGIELKIYGRINFPEDEGYLKRLKHFSRGDPRIEFCGELTAKNYTRAMSSFDIIAVPSTWLETGPYIILEAFQEGIPVIGSNLGGVAELVEHNVNGMLVKPDSVRAWSEVLAWIYSHPDSINTWARQIPAIRSSKEVAEEMNAIYLDVLAKEAKALS
jgi:glycosyltransferase involved in cell wall biosynthesis